MTKIKSRKAFFALLLLAPLVAFLLYRQAIDYFFFQDDFYEIVLAKSSNLSEFFSLFRFLDNRSSYRPIGLGIYFLSSYLIFGLNPLPFKIITFGFLVFSSFLTISLFKKITGNFYIGLLTAAIWITSSIHFMSIAWAAAAWVTIGTCFFLLTSVLFLKFLENKKKFFYILSIVAFLVTLGSAEFFIAWPIIFTFYLAFLKKLSITKTAKIIMPFTVITIIYGILRTTHSSLPDIPEYQLAVNTTNIKSLFWYLLWTFNIPEEFKKQAVNNVLIFNPIFVADYWQLILKSFSSAILLITIGILIPFSVSIKKKIRLNINLILFSFTWFLAGILPVIFFPNHFFAMYLSLPSIGIYFLISYLTINFLKSPMVISVILIWLFTSFTTVKFYTENFWIDQSQRFAKKFVLDIKSQFPRLPENAVVFYELQDQRNIQTLSGQNAIKAIYNNNLLKIYYNKEDLLSNIKNTEDRPVYIFVPE